MTHWLLLSGAIVSEVIATLSLKASNGFTRPVPSLVVVAGYGMAFYLMSLTLRSMPIGIVYAVWSGLGIALITLASWLIYGQRLDAAALCGIALIVAGVGVMNIFSGSVSH